MQFKASLPWAKILIENLLLWLTTDLRNMADGELKKELLGEDGKGIWRTMDPNVGPFESPDVDYRNWIKYVHSRDEIVRKRIRDIENRLLLTGLTESDPLSQETHGKIPEGDNNKGEGSTSETPLMKTIRDSFPAIKHHLELLRNWSDYLGDIRFNEKTPFESIDEVTAALERNLDETDPSELKRLNRMIGEILKKEKRPGREKILGGEGDVLREMQRRLSETFLYRNITLEEIKQMSKIVDFVERYRGNVRRLRGGRLKLKAMKRCLRSGELSENFRMAMHVNG